MGIQLGAAVVLSALVGLGGYAFAVRDAETRLPDHDAVAPPEPDAALRPQVA
ncbi:MAG: hypothetical protein J7M39_05030 [Anaerolineae bacterium]|nr:hypothetical protein [Anaerolineae bacterium]